MNQSASTVQAASEQPSNISIESSARIVYHASYHTLQSSVNLVVISFEGSNYRIVHNQSLRSPKGHLLPWGKIFPKRGTGICNFDVLSMYALAILRSQIRNEADAAPDYAIYAM